MRRTISAQSCASVPPASAWMVTTASPASYSPEKSASSCSRSSSRRSGTIDCRDVVGEVRVELEQLARVVVLADEPVVALDPLRQPRVLGRDGGGVLLVVPESGLSELLLRAPRVATSGDRGQR